MANGKVVLITGASRGIGYSTAQLMAKHGWKVYAGFRKKKSRVPGCVMVYLDVCDSGSMRKALATIRKKEGRLDALVNNAGWGLMGALEDLDERDLREQFDTNVLGLIMMTKLALPMLRESKGTIVNISSVVGLVAFPFGSAYAATKFAVEGLSDSLRVELRPFGVRVVIVEPGPIKTDFAATSMKSFSKLRERDSPYAKYYAAMRAVRDANSSRFGLPAERVAEMVLVACNAKRPRQRYLIAGMTGFVIPLKKLLVPGDLFDWAVAKGFGLER